MAERLITMTLVDDSTLTTTITGADETIDDRALSIATAIAGRGFSDSTTVPGTTSLYPAHRIVQIDITTPEPEPEPEPEA